MMYKQDKLAEYCKITNNSKYSKKINIVKTYYFMFKFLMNQISIWLENNENDDINISIINYLNEIKRLS